MLLMNISRAYNKISENSLFRKATLILSSCYWNYFKWNIHYQIPHVAFCIHIISKTFVSLFVNKHECAQAIFTTEKYV